jgi:alpha-1,3-rhamnosyl/mannosyltransferase
MGIGENFCPQSSESIAAVRFRTGLPDRYLLYVGTVEPRKNLSTLLRAYCDLPGELRASCPLVIGGSWGWKSEAERQLFEGEARDKGVRYLGYIADDDLPALYAGALALLYPSFYEGFGLPPVEAMACGTPAIVSTADAVREVVGAQALLIDPADLSGWRDALKRTVADADYLAEYRLGAVSHAAQFRWKRSASITLSVYRRVLDIAQSDAKVPSVRAA